ncbi:MAG: EamA/RhaT family transporter, partial [Pseudomonadota bacterium]
LIVALLGWLILGEILAPLAWLGIGIAFLGILFVSIEGGARGLVQWLRGLKQPSALTGLSAGFLFALTAIFIKQSANAIPDVERTYAGLIVLTAVLGFQALMQGAYVLIREPDQFR